MCYPQTVQHSQSLEELASDCPGYLLRNWLLKALTNITERAIFHDKRKPVWRFKPAKEFDEEATVVGPNKGNSEQAMSSHFPFIYKPSYPRFFTIIAIVSSSRQRPPVLPL
jgi:hypothetical protein